VQANQSANPNSSQDRSPQASTLARYARRAALLAVAGWVVTISINGHEFAEIFYVSPNDYSLILAISAILAIVAVVLWVGYLLAVRQDRQHRQYLTMAARQIDAIERLAEITLTLREVRKHCSSVDGRLAAIEARLGERLGEQAVQREVDAVVRRLERNPRPRPTG
jgi:lipopolysaccharide biosynthesis protein